MVIDKNDQLIDNTVQIMTVDRKTKESRVYAPEIEYIDHVMKLKLDINQLNFDNSDKNALDLSFLINGKKFRVHKETIDLEKKNKYSATSFHLSKTRIVVPYLTVKNNVSLVYGNASMIFKSYCDVIADKLTVEDVTVENGKVLFKLKEFIHNPNDSFHVVLSHSGNKSNRAIDYELVENNPLELQIDLSTLESSDIGTKYELAIEKKTGYLVKQYKLGVSENFNIENNKFYEPIKITRLKAVAPYLTIKGELAFLIVNDNYLDSKTAPFLEEILYFEDISLDRNNLKIKLKKDEQLDEYNRYSLVVSNTKTSDVLTLLQHEGSFNEHGEINVNLSQLFVDPLFQQNQRWKLYLKLYTEESVILYEIKKDSVWIESPVLRHMKPIEINEEISVINYVSGKNEVAFLIGGEEAYRREVYRKLSSRTSIDDVKVMNENLMFRVPSFQYDELESIRVILTERKTKEQWSQYVSPKMVHDDALIKIDLTDFIKNYETVDSRWDLSLEIIHDKIIEQNKIGYYHYPKLLAHERFFESITTNTSNLVTPYLTLKNELSLVIKQEFPLVNEKLKSTVELTHFQMEKNIINGEFTLELPECSSYEVSAIMLKYRHKIENREYRFDAKEIKRIRNKSKVKFEFDILPLEFENYFWDIYAVVSISGKEYPIKLKKTLAKVKESIDKKIVKYSFTYNNGFQFYPYITAVGNLAFVYREKMAHESLSFKIKENAAYFTYLLFKKYFDRKDIWLAFEKFSEGAQDNGYYFFKYCYENNKKKNFYYIIKDTSPDYNNMEPMKNKVIKYMSFKHMLYLYASTLLVSSESRGHSYDIRIEKGKLREAIKRKKHVFLQHGVIALKRIDSVFKKKATNANATDLFVVSSDYEKSIITDVFDYKDEEVIVTGLSRWDVLTDKSSDKKSIMLMPTWRSWMDDLPDEKFIETDYYKNYITLLNSPKLANVLDTFNVSLDFYIHPKFKAYIDKFSSENARIRIYQYGEEKVNELLMKSSMLITDYSSVAWETYYQKKPVLFFQFDIDDYNKYQGSYLDMENDLFGERVFDINSLVQMIEDYTKRDFKEKETFSEMRPDYFKYIDQKNSERIFKAIMDKRELLNLSKNPTVLNRLKKFKTIKKSFKILKKNKLTNKLTTRLHHILTK